MHLLTCSSCSFHPPQPHRLQASHSAAGRKEGVGDTPPHMISRWCLDDLPELHAMLLLPFVHSPCFFAFGFLEVPSVAWCLPPFPLLPSLSHDWVGLKHLNLLYEENRHTFTSLPFLKTLPPYHSAPLCHSILLPLPFCYTPTYHLSPYGACHACMPSAVAVADLDMGVWVWVEPGSLGTQLCVCSFGLVRFGFSLVRTGLQVSPTPATPQAGRAGSAGHACAAQLGSCLPLSQALL